MRYIDPQQVEVCKPVNWDVKAMHWLAVITSAVDKSAKFKQLGSVWSPFKDIFIQHFGDKCWYSEAPRIGTDFNIDHFRPKGAVKKSKRIYASQMTHGKSQNHPGYWWLAFEAKNYRYSCQYANQPRDNGGKHDYFPLIDETTRIWGPCSLAAHIHEQVQLLDPCEVADVELISFEKDPGAAQSRFEKATDPIKYERVKISAKCYNLNHKTVKDERLKVIKAVNSDLTLLETIWSLPQNYKLMMQNSVDDAENRLVAACDRKSPFSAAAVAFVRTKIAESWMVNVLPRLDLTP